MAHTITNTITHGVTYSAAGDNPFTIASGGAILAKNSSAALSLTSGLEWTVVNNGQVSARVGYGINATLATVTNTGLIAGGANYGIQLLGDATLADSVVINSGTITDSRPLSSKPAWYSAVYFGAAGEVTNQASGLISGASNGVMTSYHDLYADDVINQGTIIGAGVDGVTAAARLTLINSGRISGGQNGVATNTYSNGGRGGTYVGGNFITNLAGGQITGGSYGVSLAGSSTLANAGTIGGTSAAVTFASGGTDRLIDDPGAVFNGAVNGGNTLGSSVVSTLELASGASAGTLSGLGVAAGFTNFAAIGVDAGASWVLSGTNTLASGATLTDAGNLTLASSLAGTGTLAFSGSGHTLTVDQGVGITPTIAGFGNNTVALLGVHATSASFGGGKLTLTGTGAPVTLALAGSYSTSNFHVSYLNGETVFTACFAEGTAIETEFGPLPVERLGPGMRIRTTSGALRPLRWLGHRHHTAAEIATRDELRPVRIAAGALGGGLPRRPLRLSPEHALLLDGVLVPAIQLLGVPGIAQEAEPDAVTYFHVELDTHDTILAEGTPSETYIDTHSNAVFDNPETRPAPPATIPCAPRITSGPVLAAIRARLGATQDQPAPGTLRGNIEATTPGAIAGWAASPAAGVPIRLNIAADGIPLGTALANGFRFDLQRAGMGAAAFTFNGPIPQGTRSIAITSDADGTHVPGSPFLVEA